MVDKQIQNLKVHSTETFCPHPSDMSSFLWQKICTLTRNCFIFLFFFTLSRCLSLFLFILHRGNYCGYQPARLFYSRKKSLKKIRNVLQRIHLKMYFLALLIITYFEICGRKYIEILTSKIFWYLWNAMVLS